WREVCDYATQIERQLGETPAAASPASPVPAGRSRIPVLSGIAVVLALVAAAVVFMKGRKPGLPPAPPPLAVAGGSHPAPDGGSVELAPFELFAHEVTIAEYAGFLAELARLPAARRTDYDAPGQPASKTGHEPDDWDAMHAAA